MAKQTVNVGTSVNDGTGDSLRSGGAKINQNFDELYAAADQQATATTAIEEDVEDLETAVASLQNPPADPQAISYTVAIPFDGEKFMDPHYVAGAVAFTVGAATPKLGGYCVVTLLANGTNVPTFVGMFERSGSSAYVNTLNQLNQIIFWFDGQRYWYTISTAVGGLTVVPPDETPPTLVSAVVENAAPGQVVMTYGEALDEDFVPALADYGFSGGRSVSALSVLGNVVTATVTPAYAFGDSITFDYTPGVDPLQDAAGNEAAALLARAVTNNIEDTEELVATPVTFTVMDRMTGPVDGIYTATSAGTSTTAQGITGMVLPADSIGWIQCSRPVIGSPSQVSCVIALDAVASGLQTYGLNDLIGQISATGVVSYGENTASLTSTGYTLPEGDGSHMRLYRDDDNIVTLETTVDDGENWTVRRTFPTARDTDLVPHFYTTYSTTARKLPHPEAYGLVSPP
jgi:hypothetical protein